LKIFNLAVSIKQKHHKLFNEPN